MGSFNAAKWSLNQTSQDLCQASRLLQVPIKMLVASKLVLEIVFQFLREKKILLAEKITSPSKYVGQVIKFYSLSFWQFD